MKPLPYELHDCEYLDKPSVSNKFFIGVFNGIWMVAILWAIAVILWSVL
jgi:hypothetical protein